MLYQINELLYLCKNIAGSCSTKISDMIISLRLSNGLIAIKPKGMGSKELDRNNLILINVYDDQIDKSQIDKDIEIKKHIEKYLSDNPRYILSKNSSKLRLGFDNKPDLFQKQNL